MGTILCFLIAPQRTIQLLASDEMTGYEHPSTNTHVARTVGVNRLMEGNDWSERLPGSVTPGTLRARQTVTHRLDRLSTTVQYVDVDAPPLTVQLIASTPIEYLISKGYGAILRIGGSIFTAEMKDTWRRSNGLRIQKSGYGFVLHRNHRIPLHG